MIYYVISILIVVVLCGAVWYLIKNKNESEKELVMAEKERDEYAELGKGLAEYNQKLQEKKNKMKDKIMELIRAKGEISNRETAKALGVSRASVARYFDELEKEGSAKQVGKIGQNVIYKKP